MGAMSNHVRIIAGQWRGRKLSFPDGQGLRPTADRVRETLFNWLAPVLPGARCLDLFAGSGALGFEAASRGAAHVVMVETNPRAVAQLQASQALLCATDVEILRCDAEQYLSSASAEPFDIVFLDPPFDQPKLFARIPGQLENFGFLKPGGYVYLEMPAKGGVVVLPESWAALRQKTAGQVAYHLYRRAV